jgi:hypothetical protein
MRLQDARRRPHAGSRGYRLGPDSPPPVPRSSAARPLPSPTRSAPGQKRSAKSPRVLVRVPHPILQGFGHSPSRETPVVNDDE